MRKWLTPLLATLLAVAPMAHATDAARWTPAEADAWYSRQQWLVGANYTTSNAINQLEMFQAETFDPAAIDRELRWAHEQFGICLLYTSPSPRD